MLIQHAVDVHGEEIELYLRDGKIQAVGRGLTALADPEEAVVDAKGLTVLPAFVDGHSHITALAQTLGLCQLSGCGSLEEMGRRMKAFRFLSARKSPEVRRERPPVERKTAAGSRFFCGVTR